MTLTRRRDNTENLEQWSIWDGDVCVGLMRNIGSTGAKMVWQWSCWGNESGSEDTYEAARAAFQKAWDRIWPTITEAERDAFRFQEAHTAWKYAMWDAGCRMPTQSPEGWSVCFCGTRITTNRVSDHIRAVHMGPNAKKPPPR